MLIGIQETNVKRHCKLELSDCKHIILQYKKISIAVARVSSSKNSFNNKSCDFQ